MNGDTWERRDYDPPNTKLQQRTGIIWYANEEKKIEMNLRTKAKIWEQTNLLKWWPSEDQEMKNNSEMHQIDIEGISHDWKWLRGSHEAENDESSREWTKI